MNEQWSRMAQIFSNPGATRWLVALNMDGRYPKTIRAVASQRSGCLRPVAAQLLPDFDPLSAVVYNHGSNFFFLKRWQHEILKFLPIISVI